jgi:hypothetical protein
MALYGGQRDASLIRSLNKELINRIIDTEILFYKLNLESTTSNIYDETNAKVYNAPVLIPSVVNLDDEIWNSEDFGSDITQNATFAFLKDSLVDINLHPDVGDIIEYRSRFFELDSIVDNQNLAGKDPDSWFGGSEHGYSVSVICLAHMTRQSKVNIVKTRFGTSETIKNQTLPKNL